MGRRLDPKPRKVTIIRYQDPAGRRVHKSHPQAIRVKVQSDTYYVCLPDPITRKPVYHSLQTGELVLAWSRLRAILQQRREAELGLVDDFSRHSGRPILDHLEEWLSSVTAGGATDNRARLMRSRVARLIQAAGWQRIGEIRRAACQSALASLQSSGLSAQTRNHYLSHVRQFVRWLVDEQRLRSDPLAGLSPISVEDDRRHDRRCPGDEEVEILFGHLAGRIGQPAIRMGMSGECRSLAYQVAMCSGLRAGELRSLTWDRIDLATGQINLGAAAAKNRRRTIQPLARWLCDLLAGWKAAGGTLWSAFPAGWPGRLLKADLALARESWIAQARGAERSRRESSPICLYQVAGPDGPLFWDFHALRHWYVSQVASQQGISPATMQALVRHSDPKLTLGVYAKARQDQLRSAADQIRLPGT